VIDHYRRSLSPVFPVLSPVQLCQPHTLSAFQVLSICAVSALHRDVPRGIAGEMRGRLHQLLAASSDALLWTSNLGNLSALLISCMSAEVHGVTANMSGSLALLRAGLAIRMGQDLGLHRLSSRTLPAQTQSIRPVLWCATVFTDTW
jgi:hypothetical protein